jgi:hypothetical protein
MIRPQPTAAVVIHDHDERASAGDVLDSIDAAWEGVGVEHDLPGACERAPATHDQVIRQSQQG